jgi:cell division protein FtsB
MTSKRKQIDSLSTQLAGLARNQAVLQTKNSDLNDKLKGFVNAMANLKAACNGRC